MTMTISRSSSLAIAMVGAFLAPTFAFGQDSSVTARTHIVRKGDTLWDLAREYTSDPYRWKQLYELNTATVRDPHWIYPGERLRLPGEVAAADATAASQPLASSSPRGQASPAEPTVELAAAPMVSVLDGPTVFKRAADERSRERRIMVARSLETEPAQARASAPAVRAGEVIAAPYVEPVGGPPNAGRIVGSGDVPEIPLTETDRPLQSHERVFVLVPPGMSAAPGTRYVTVRRGPLLEGVGQVMVPTGVVALERAQPGQAVEARIVARFEPMLIGDELVTMETAPANLPRPTLQTNGARTSVLWIEGAPVLPSLQSYVVLDGGAASGMRVGDQVTFYRERRTTEDGVVLPGTDVAVAQIVRVTPQASTAILIDQAYGAVREGTVGRVTAKMP